MATFKRLTRTGGGEVDVNIDTVVYMQWYTDQFPPGRGRIPRI